MPARSVVLEKLVKWNGEPHADITPGEYTQLTGRAGRRGIDVEGHAVVLWQPGMDPAALAGLASPAPTRCAPASGPRTTWRSTWCSSSAGTARASCSRRRSRSSRRTGRWSGSPARCRSNEEGLEGYREAMTCHLGDFEEYARLRRELKDRETELAKQGAAQRRAAAASLAGEAEAR